MEVRLDQPRHDRAAAASIAPRPDAPSARAAGGTGVAMISAVFDDQDDSISRGACRSRRPIGR